MKFLQLFCGSSSGTFSCPNWVKILTWGSVYQKKPKKQLLIMSAIPKRVCYTFVSKHNIPLNHTLLSNHTWKMITLPSSAWRYNVHEEVMKLWAWFITSSHRPLTKVRGYSMCILGTMASNCKNNNNKKKIKKNKNWELESQTKTIEWVLLTPTCSCRRSANGSWLWQPRLQANCSSLWE